MNKDNPYCTLHVSTTAELVSMPSAVDNFVDDGYFQGNDILRTKLNVNAFAASGG